MTQFPNSMGNKQPFKNVVEFIIPHTTGYTVSLVNMNAYLLNTRTGLIQEEKNPHPIVLHLSRRQHIAEALRQ